MHYSEQQATLQPQRDEDAISKSARPRNKFQRHLHILVWKSYVQRQRRWRLLLLETFVACIFFTIAVFIAMPVFLTALEPEPEPPISTSDILSSLDKKNIVGFAPLIEPYMSIMTRAAVLLEHDIYGAATEEDLNINLLIESKSEKISDPVIWIIWKPNINDTWQFSIRSTERAMHETSSTATFSHQHLRAGFLAVQMAISRAIIEHAATTTLPDYTMTLVSMPVSPLMQEESVRRALSGILLCFTLALMAPTLEIVALVVHESVTQFKRALCLRGVSFVSMYTSWLMYALMTSLPICILASITLILIFRWVHLILVLVLMLSYATVMIMFAFIMSMFHSKKWLACVWTALFAFLQTYLAELLVHHQYDKEHDGFSFILHVLLPPLGLVHAFNNLQCLFVYIEWLACVWTALFAFLQTYLAELLVHHQYDKEHDGFSFILHVLLPPLGLVHAFNNLQCLFVYIEWLACVWTALFAFLQTYLAELLVHHQYDKEHDGFSFILHVLLPPLGLVHAFNNLQCLFVYIEWLACVWTALFAFLQTYLAELLVHHQYDKEHDGFSFILHVLLPPLGLVHAFNNLQCLFVYIEWLACVWTALFAFLQTYLAELLVHHQYNKEHDGFSFILHVLLPLLGLVHAFNNLQCLFVYIEWLACVWTALFAFLQTYLAELLVHHQYDKEHDGFSFILHVLLPPLGLVHAFNNLQCLFVYIEWLACVWTALFAFLQTYLAELLVHHQYDKEHDGFSFILHVLLPPLGLVHAFNNFALLQTGQSHTEKSNEDTELIIYTLFCWAVSCVLSFLLLMMFQYTLKDRAIYGQMSWKAIIFKKAEDVNQLRVTQNPTGIEHDRLQEVDGLVAKAISFRSVTKSVMGVVILSNVTFDIYRGEFTMLFTEHIQEKILQTLEGLITGLTLPDSGTVTVCGQETSYESNVMTTPHLMGYCHRPSVLLEELTVREHLIMYFDIVLWSETREYIFQYSDIRTAQLLQECDLTEVANYRVQDVDVYYQAQLCWAIAMMLEPRVIFLPHPEDSAGYLAVIKHKIMEYRKLITIVTKFHSSFHLEYADRVFLFDTKILTFGGTPAYMFFQYGREYKFRMTLRSERGSNDEATEALLAKAAEAGATVRAHLGSLLILQVPASPTERVAKLVEEVHHNPAKYGLISMNISVPDCEEVFRRAISEARHEKEEIETIQNCKDASIRFAEPVEYKHNSSLKQFKVIGWKVYYFYVNNKLFLMLLLSSAFMAGIVMGLSFSRLLLDSERESADKILLHGELLTVENTNRKTILIMRSDESTTAMSVANSYVFSEVNSNKKNVDKIYYTAIKRSENLVEYLVTRAIDAPQKYIFVYAYGLDIYENKNGTLIVNALYCPLHHDYGAAARSMAKSFTALLRHCTGNYAASIQVTDDPLALDLSPWMKFAKTPPLLTQFLLIVSTCHLTLIPSLEYGLIRHTQMHGMNFSPARYWLTLYMWDLIVYWMMVAIMFGMMLLVMLVMAPGDVFNYFDLLMVPLLLSFYGMSCIPQAYLFSLGPRVALNFMTYIFVNVIFGETTIIAKIFYGDILDVVHIFMSLSPQFNIAYALVKIKTTYLYNSECYFFQARKLCAKTTLHKCCEKCGVLQACFTRKAYVTRIFYQLLALITTAMVLMSILMLIEYQVFNRLWKCLVMRWLSSKPADAILKPGAAREKVDVEDKRKQISFEQNLPSHSKGKKIDTFGEHILAYDLTKKHIGLPDITGIYLGVGKGEAVAITGLKLHGRRQLCDLLAGVTMADEGHVWAISKWLQEKDPHMYAQHISYSCDRETLPQWMTVYDGLYMIAILRGVPKKHAHAEVMNLIDAMDLNKEVGTQIRYIPRIERTKLHFVTALVGSPPVIILDEYTAYQKFSVRRAMYNILANLKKNGHALIMCSNNVESNLPVTNRLALLHKGSIYDIDAVDELVARYSTKGFTVVLHLKDEVNVKNMFSSHFDQFLINDTSEVLVNVQILDPNLNWATIFAKMETLKHSNQKVYSYIITVTTIDYIYNKLLQSELVSKPRDFYSFFKTSSMDSKIKFRPNHQTLRQLRPFKTKYNITKLNELPWSVIFHR